MALEFLVRLLEAFKSVLLGVFRLVLMIVTFLFAIGALVGIVTLPKSTHNIGNGTIEQLYDQQFQLMFYLIYGINLFIALLGTYGAYNANNILLKRFSLLSFTSAIIMLCYIVYSSTHTDAQAQSRNKFVKQLTESMPLYNWDMFTNQSSEWTSGYSATALWDDVQSDSCCGLANFRDWDQYRPTGIPSSLYPRSCCPLATETHDGKGPFCVYTREMYWFGCIEAASKLWSTSFSLYIFYTVLFFAMSALAHLLSIKGETGTTTTSSRSFSFRHSDVKLFDHTSPQRGDVAVQVWHSQSPVGQPLPPIYPNPYQINQAPPNAGPPPPYNSKFNHSPAPAGFM